MNTRWHCMTYDELCRESDPDDDVVAVTGVDGGALRRVFGDMSGVTADSLVNDLRVAAGDGVES